MNTKPKIIIIGPAYPYRGGNSLFVSHLYDILKDGFDVKVYNYKLLYPSFLFPGTTQYDESDSLIKKAPNERLVSSINPFNWFSVASRLKQENADLVIFDWWHPFFALCHYTISSLIRSKYRGKILFITENFISHEGSIFDRALTSLGLKHADKFIALSERVTRDLAVFAPHKKVYKSELPIYDCYDFHKVPLLKSQFGFPDDAIVLLFFGYIRKYKGLDILIESIPEILAGNDKIRLLIVGESYEQISIYTDLIAKFGLQDKVTLINKFVPNEDVGQYYSLADLVVLPYRSATQSGILNIAYGFGKPVLATRVGGLMESIEEGKTGFLAEPENAHSLASGVQQFLNARTTINFEKEISAKNKQNLFYSIPAMIQEVLDR